MRAASYSLQDSSPGLPFHLNDYRRIDSGWDDPLLIEHPPALIGPDRAEIYLNMKVPVGTRTIWMKFARHGDAWTITYSEEVQ